MTHIIYSINLSGLGMHLRLSVPELVVLRQIRMSTLVPAVFFHLHKYHEKSAKLNITDFSRDNILGCRFPCKGE